MVRSITLGLVVFGAAATLAAQAPAPAPAQQPYPPAPTIQTQPPAAPAEPATRTATPESSMAPKVTYTGCLKPGTTPGSWLLDSASLSTAGAPATDRAVGTSGVASSESFGLTAKPTDNLKPHANHKIEVTGVVGPAIATSMSSESSASAATKTTTPRQNITIESFKMVSATCP